MKQNILQTERVYYAIEQMEQISQVLIRKIETDIGMFHVNKLSQGTMGAGWNDVLYNAYCFNLIFERINKMDLDKHSATFLMLAAVVASTPTTSNLSIWLTTALDQAHFSHCRTKPPATPPILYPPLLHGGYPYLQLLLLFISFVLPLSCCSQLDP